MEARALILIFTLVFVFLRGAHSATFTFQNRCSYTVWPGILTGANAQLPNTGFVLSPGGSFSLEVPAPWSGRIWGRTHCSTDSDGKFICATADCGSNQISCNGAGATAPASLIEFTLAANGGKDFYDVSLVDGFNLPLSVTPKGGSGDCQAPSCPSDINSACPPELALKGADGKVIGCKSACLAFNQPKYCCTGAYARPDTCTPSDYSRFFKSQCNQAYSYAYDDKTSLSTCSSGPDYGITFCP